MDIVMFKDIVRHFPNTLMLSFIGNGEPLLCKDLFDMINHARVKDRMTTSMFTNGLLLDKFMDRILGSRLDILNISVNAHTAEGYRYFTGHNDDIFNKVVSNVKALVHERDVRKAKLRISVSLIICQDNYREIVDMARFADGLGVDEVNIFQCLPTEAPGWSSGEKSLFVTDDEVRRFFDDLKLPPLRVTVHLPALLDGRIDNRLCRDSFYGMSIDGDGNVSGCERQLLNCAGNGKYFDRGVFNNRHFQELRTLFLSNDSPLPKPCRTCYNNTACCPVHLRGVQ